MNPDLAKQYLLMAVRWAVAMFGVKVIAWVAAQTGMPVDQTTEVIATVVVGGVMFIWGLFNKAHLDNKIETALQLNTNASRETLEIALKNQKLLKS